MVTRINVSPADKAVILPVLSTDTILVSSAKYSALKYQSSNPQVAEINAAGIVTLKNTGETNITITSSSNPDINAVYKVIVETLPKNVVFERFDYGVAVGETSKIIPVYEP